MEYKLFFAASVVEGLRNFHPNVVRGSLKRLKMYLGAGVISEIRARQADSRVGRGQVLSAWIAVSYYFDTQGNCVVLALVDRRKYGIIQG